MSESIRYELIVDGVVVKINEKNYEALLLKYSEWMNRNGRGAFTEIHCQDGSRLMTVPFEAFCVGYVKCALELNLGNGQFK